jgi:hypothetical protein
MKLRSLSWIDFVDAGFSPAIITMLFHPVETLPQLNKMPNAQVGAHKRAPAGKAARPPTDIIPSQSVKM